MVTIQKTLLHVKCALAANHDRTDVQVRMYQHQPFSERPLQQAKTATAALISNISARIPKTGSLTLVDLQPSSSIARSQWNQIDAPHFAIHSLLGLTPTF